MPKVAFEQEESDLLDLQGAQQENEQLKTLTEGLGKVAQKFQSAIEGLEREVGNLQGVAAMPQQAANTLKGGVNAMAQVAQTLSVAAIILKKIVEP